MKTSILGLLFFLLIDCNPKINKIEEKNDTQNINRYWMLVEFKNYSKEYLIKKEAFLDLKTNRAVSKMGCNNISYEFELKNNSEITFTKGIATQMACTEMQLEDDFMKILNSITNYKIIGHQLTLSNKNGDKMVFIAQDWD
jgi:heat shock protein HslJ